MKTEEFFRKLFSRYLMGHLAAMVVVVALMCVGVKYGLDLYTHHGEGIPVPNVKGMDSEKARAIIEADGLLMVVSDSGYNRRLPAGSVLVQSPGYGAKVKEGHTVYVTVNAGASPTVTIPDIVDNCSSREAMARLRALGFKLGDPKSVTGEKDWVYGLECNGRRIANGDAVNVDQMLTLLVGNGQYDDDQVDIDYSPIEREVEELTGDDSETDDFEEVEER